MRIGREIVAFLIVNWFVMCCVCGEVGLGSVADKAMPPTWGGIQETLNEAVEQSANQGGDGGPGNRKRNNGSSLNSEEDLEEEGGKEEEKGRMMFLFEISNNPDDIKFLLHRDSKNINKSEELFLNDVESVQNSSFEPREKTVFIIHGFWSNRSSGMPNTIKNSFLAAGVPYNLIVVDWGKLSTPNPKRDTYSPISYPIVVRRNIPIAYQRVGEFIQFLVDEKFAKLDKLHIIGHSLGSHVSGGAGAVVQKYERNKGKKVARITGLDPAGPLFQGIKVQRRIGKDDADFVDIYHTAAGTLGDVIYDEGHADFMPNGGHHQPGCVDFMDPILFEAEAGSCSHAFVYKIYGASIQKNFTACRCEPRFRELILGTSCPGNCEESVLAGEQCPPDARGQFYFETGEDPFEDEKKNQTESGESLLAVNF